MLASEMKLYRLKKWQNSSYANETVQPAIYATVYCHIVYLFNYIPL